MNSNNTLREDSLTIEYSLSRNEILRSFWISVAMSPKFRQTIILYSIAAGVFLLLLRVFVSHSLRWVDVIVAALWAICFFIVLPFWMFVTGKTAKRTLTVSGNGIATEIGRIKARIPWNKIRVIADTPQFVLIVRTNGNAFFIPNRAFSGSDHRTQFLTAVGHWVEKP